MVNYKLLTACMALCIQSLTLTPLYDDPTNVNGNELTAMYCSIESGEKCDMYFIIIPSNNLLIVFE